MQYDKPKYQRQLSVYKMKDSGHYNINKKEVNNDKFQKGKRTDSTKQKEKKKKKRKERKGLLLTCCSFTKLQISAVYYPFT